VGRAQKRGAVGGEAPTWRRPPSDQHSWGTRGGKGGRVERTVEKARGGRGCLRGAVVTRPGAGERQRGRGGSATVAMPLRSASSRVIGALHASHESG